MDELSEMMQSESKNEYLYKYILPTHDHVCPKIKFFHWFTDFFFFKFWKFYGHPVRHNGNDMGSK